MPIVSRTSNRVLPSNSRAVDVARATMDIVAPLQRLKQHAAIAVQGFDVCIYHRLTAGTRCHCQTKQQPRTSVLLDNGEAPPQLLNELLTGGQRFGVSPYGSTHLDDLPKASASATSRRPSLFRIDQDAIDASVAEDLYGEEPTASVGTMFDTYSNDKNVNASTYVSSGVGAGGPVHESDFETLIDDAVQMDGGYGIMDAVCPVCMGTGYVGGYSLLNGWRRVLNFQYQPADSPDASVYAEEVVPPIVLPANGTYTFERVVLPYGAVSVDAVRLWNVNATAPGTLRIDGVQLRHDADMLPYCDGLPHDLTVCAQPDAALTFTHLELQVNQSTESCYIDFPKLVRGNIKGELDNMQDVELVVSPIVPLMRPDDFIADSVHQKVYQATSVTMSSDRRLTVQGWEVSARVVTAAELQNLLPRRRRTPIPAYRAPPLPHDDPTGPHRV